MARPTSVQDQIRAKEAQIRALKPGAGGDRIYIDKLGTFHVAPGARTFADSVAHHARERNLAVAEALCVVRRLLALGALRPNTLVEKHGAVVQAFAGTAGYEGCHVIPCQLVFDNQLPFDLRVPNGRPGGRPLTSIYLERVVKLFARCCLKHEAVNDVDQALDHTQPGGLADRFVEAIHAVLRGALPARAFDAYKNERAELLRLLLAATYGNRNMTRAEVLLHAGTRGGDPEGEIALGKGARREELRHFQEARLVVLEVYFETAREVPIALSSGELQKEIDREPWLPPA
jgi:hypothetical protein